MKTIALTLALTICTTANALTLPPMPMEKVADMRSNAGEQLPDFLKRVGVKLRSYSEKTGFEACAAIASHGNDYGVVITTTKSHIGCLVHHDMLPDGMTDMGETIHSHGIDANFSINRSDRAFLKMWGIESPSLMRMTGQNIYHFSPADYLAGKGYLATPDGVIHQDGK